MTKDDLKKLCDLRGELEAKERELADQEERGYQLYEKRKIWRESVLMSSTDAACRIVESRVDSADIAPKEIAVKVRVQQLKAELADTQERYDLLEAEVIAWLLTLDDWRIRDILKKRYLLGQSVKEVAGVLNYSENSIINWESRFWGGNGKKSI